MPRTERMARMQPTTRTKSCRGVDVAELHSYAYGFDRIITTRRPAKIECVAIQRGKKLDPDYLYGNLPCYLPTFFLAAKDESQIICIEGGFGG